MFVQYIKHRNGLEAIRGVAVVNTDLITKIWVDKVQEKPQDIPTFEIKMLYKDRQVMIHDMSDSEVDIMEIFNRLLYILNSPIGHI